MGVGENIKGTLKEKAGELSGNDELEAEGRAQRQK
ncbi:MAG: CsbD-like, partial [Frankiaceae bacterium]|nr:CsbD-like [Frankiaceae bacterium]